VTIKLHLALPFFLGEQTGHEITKGKPIAAGKELGQGDCCVE
jgi:hypothetical protein